MPVPGDRGRAAAERPRPALHATRQGAISYDSVLTCGVWYGGAGPTSAGCTCGRRPCGGTCGVLELVGRGARRR
eukprot:2586032-Rhodomonas_salina.1